MADNLFPAFDLPEETEEQEDEKYYPSVYFDFEKGDFRLDGSFRMVQADGREAYIQWCLKMLETEREAYLAYSDQLGVEFEALHNTPTREERESDIEETIIDALMVHPCTEYVRDFEFEHHADSCTVTFAVKGFGYDEQPMKLEIPER